jgi:hypothetical protein
LNGPSATEITGKSISGELTRVLVDVEKLTVRVRVSQLKGKRDFDLELQQFTKAIREFVVKIRDVEEELARLVGRWEKYDVGMDHVIGNSDQTVARGDIYRRFEVNLQLVNRHTVLVVVLIERVLDS